MHEVGQVNNWLQSQHVLVSQEWLDACLDWLHQENQGASLPLAQLNRMVHEQWLQADLQVVAPGCLPQGIAEEQKTVLNGKFALQINSMIDVSVPAYTQLQKLRGRENANDAVTAETQATQKPWEQRPTRMLMLQLTDGQQDLQGMEYQPIRELQVDMAPGTKILVSGPVQCRLGVLLLDGKNVKVLGGEVEELAEENRMENVLLKAVSDQGTADPTLVQQQQQIQQEYRQSTANNARNAASTRQQNNQGQGRQHGRQGNAGFGQGNNADVKAEKKTPQPPMTFTDDFEDDDFLDNMDLGELEMLENQEMPEAKPPKTETLQNPPAIQQRQNMNSFPHRPNNPASFPKSVKTEQTKPIERVTQMSNDNFSTRNPPAARSGHNQQGAREIKFEPEWDEPFDLEGVEQMEERNEGHDNSSRQVKQENPTSTRLNRSDVFQIDDEPDWDDPLLMEGMAGNMNSIDNDVWDDPFEEEEGGQPMMPQGTRKDGRKVDESRASTVIKSDLFENKTSFEERSKPVQSVKMSLPSAKPSLRPPTVQQKSDSDVKVKIEPNINQATNVQDISDAAVPFAGARGSLSTQKLVQTVAPFSREQPPEMKKRRLDTGVDLDTPPFTYLSKVLSSLPVSNRTVVTVKAFILTLTSKLEKTDVWKISAMINDGSACVDVDLGDQVLAKLIGFTVAELKNLVVRAKTDPAIKKRIKEGLEGCQRKLIDLSCLMEVEFSPTLVKPKVIALSDVNPTVVRQLQERVERNSLH